jgi:hypothetical protein
MKMPELVFYRTANVKQTPERQIFSFFYRHARFLSSELRNGPVDPRPNGESARRATARTASGE